ncbi:MAG: hypothetical protein WB683_14310 [Candidatus Sulfotelmatobacter sp.]
MSRKDAVVLASRALALLFIVWALGEASRLPEYLHSFLHYVDENPVPSTFIEYRRHFYLIALGFLVIRIVGFSLLATWLYRGGPEVEELFSPAAPVRNSGQD